MFDESDLENRFAYHRPSRSRAADHQDVRETFLNVARELNHLLPDGREKSLVLTNLEEAMFWSNAAIARQGDVTEEQTYIPLDSPEAHD